MRATERRAARGIALAALAFLGTAGALTGQAPREERTIRVSGVGEVQARPDRAQISFAVETAAATAAAAGAENAEVMERVIAALVAAGVPASDIETRNYSLHPEYEQPRPHRGEPTMEDPRQPRIVGYRAMNQVVARTRQLDTVGRLIDAALAAGANRFDGVMFELADAEAERAEALRRAVAAARQSAEAIADALGVGLGAVLDASTTAELMRPVPMYDRREMAVAAAAPAPTPIQSGELTVRGYVNVVFSIR